MGNELPFERGTYTCGTVEVGAEFYDPKNKQHIQIYKNTDAAALAAKRLVKAETPASYEADYCVSKANGIMAVGVVDPLLGSSTVPINAYFFAVTEGVVTVAAGSGTNVAAAGELLIVASTAISANKGKVTALTAVAGSVGKLTAELTERVQVVAVSHAAVSCDSTNDTQVRLCLRK